MAKTSKNNVSNFVVGLLNCLRVETANILLLLLLLPRE
jgi:hypothetical protein